MENFKIFITYAYVNKEGDEEVVAYLDALVGDYNNPNQVMVGKIPYDAKIMQDINIDKETFIVYHYGKESARFYNILFLKKFMSTFEWRK